MGPHDPIRLVEVCPQCRRPIDGSTSRLITDVCGHTKCRICLLQEVNGCVKCSQRPVLKSPPIPPPRQSVIVRPQEKTDEGTHKIIEQSRQSNILFPSEIVKRSTGNFYHLKRAFSERFFSEGNSKADKECSTDLGNYAIFPNYIIEKYYCTIHKHTFDKTQLKFHMNCDKTPVVTERYECDHCRSVFPNTSKLNRHIRMHLSQSKFQCSDCEKMFRDNNALTVHKRTHTNEKCFTCDECGLHFKHRFTFKRHVKKHQGDFSHVCERAGCGKRFLTFVELTRHSVRHSQAKPFHCDLCGVRYAFRRSLERHKSAIHSGISIQCGICDATFRRKDNLERHIKNLHTDKE